MCIYPVVWCSGRGRVSSGGEIDYMEGTSLYYGSSVALQNCFHSGYLCMDASRRAKATPHHCRHPNAVMKVRTLCLPIHDMKDACPHP
jgi:hypothetical protein